MSKRRRNSIKPASAAQIEWLKHRTGYPSPEERLAIIRLRQEIASELLVMMVARIDPGSPRAQALFKKYGREEVERALKNLDAGMEFPSLIADDARSYRDYRQRYARFGASLKFHTAAEVEELYEQYFEQLKENEDNEAGRLLLIGWRDWEDITPPAAPSRPVDFTAPAPASYPAPINELLEWSGDLDRSHQFENEGEYRIGKNSSPR
ncbi:MAG: hypothetical protein HND47_13340 [Chloroflexi bacterium]|nr:hypothetical protein [Chloroflexota bacterium]